jgi:hypothetical protein
MQRRESKGVAVHAELEAGAAEQREVLRTTDKLMDEREHRRRAPRVSRPAPLSRVTTAAYPVESRALRQMDDLAALDWTAAAPGPPRTNGGRSPFDTLSSQGRRAASPAMPVSSSVQRQQSSGSNGAPNADDAFSSLFGSSPKPVAAQQSLSMAERLARQGGNPPAALSGIASRPSTRCDRRVG